MEKNKAVFLDRDGTINVDYGYVFKIKDLNFLPGTIKGLKKLYLAGYKLIIITNQSGIGRKIYTVSDYIKFNDCMLKQLLDEGIKIENVYYCPHTDIDNCECRKPKLALFEQAIREYNIDLANSYAIGDKERDLSICDSANVKGILIGNDSTKFYSCSNLDEAADYILRSDNR